MKNCILENLINVVWWKTPLMSLPIYQKIEMNIQDFNGLWNSLVLKGVYCCFASLMGFFLFLSFFKKKISKWSHHILENCKCLGLESFLIKIAKPFQPTKVSTQQASQELCLQLGLIYQMQWPLEQAGLPQSWAIPVMQVWREKYLLRRREITALCWVKGTVCK